MRLLFSSALIFAVAFSSVQAKKNPYMTKGTDEYKNVTEKVIGNWVVNSYIRDDRGEQIPAIYKKATIEFVGLDGDGKRGDVVWKFYLSDSVVNARSADDRAKDSTLKIDNYILKFKGKWDIYDKEANLLRIDIEKNPEIDVLGSGNTINDFAKGQNGLLSGSNALGNISGPAGFIASKAAKAGTGLNDIIAEFPYKAEFSLKDNTIDLKGNSNLLFKATK
jgi:hypothetical protein